MRVTFRYLSREANHLRKDISNRITPFLLSLGGRDCTMKFHNSCLPDSFPTALQFFPLKFIICAHFLVLFIHLYSAAFC